MNTIETLEKLTDSQLQQVEIFLSGISVGMGAGQQNQTEPNENKPAASNK